MIRIVCLSIVALAAWCSQAYAAERPHIILVFADDISARELPLYGSSVWSPPTGGNTSNSISFSIFSIASTLMESHSSFVTPRIWGTTLSIGCRSFGAQCHLQGAMITAALVL